MVILQILVLTSCASRRVASRLQPVPETTHLATLTADNEHQIVGQTISFPSIRTSTPGLEPGVQPSRHAQHSEYGGAKSEAAHVVDLENRIVYANSTQSGGACTRMKGILKRLQGLD